MMTTANMISKKGNALGFTVKGETVTGCYLAKRKAWRIDVASENGIVRLSDERGRSFAARSDAAVYASSLIDAAKTDELRWW